jgi:hypothetical protein
MDRFHPIRKVLPVDWELVWRGGGSQSAKTGGTIFLRDEGGGRREE